MNDRIKLLYFNKLLKNEKLKKLHLQAATSGTGVININDLGLGSAEDIVESMDHAEKELEELETPFE